MNLHLDFGRIIIIIFSSISMVVVSVASARVMKYFKSIDQSNRRREQKQQNYFNKIESIYYGICVSMGTIDSTKFKIAYKEKLDELTEDDRVSNGEL